jgi:CBS-domain-containing membrane protein
MNISDCMKQDVVSISSSASLGQAAALLAKRHIGTLPVIDGAGHLMGLLQLRDLLGFVMPDFVRLIESFDFVQDFGAVETHQPDLDTLIRPVREVMQPPVSVDKACGLLRAYAMLLRHQLLDLPVVGPDNRLVGIASRVDVGTTLLANWRTAPGGSET